MQEPKSYGYVKYTTIKNALKQIEEHYADCPERLEDLNLTFEYVVGSFFPKIVENIELKINEAYTNGYMQGYQEGKQV